MRIKNIHLLGRSLALFCLILVAPRSYALNIDEFIGDGMAASNVPGAPATFLTQNSSAIGGFRSLFAMKAGPGAGVARIETFADPEFDGDTDYSLGYTQGAHAGQGIITWDGEDQVTQLTPNGLGTIDFSQDGGDAVQIGIKFFDFPASQPFDMILRLYDGTNVTGLKYSDVSISLNQAINSISALAVNVPFEKFINPGISSIEGPNGNTIPTASAFGPGGGVDLSSVGAIQLILNGLTTTNAPDISLDYLRTNGQCNILPNSEGRVVDECGVCLDSVEANRGRDTCGVCLAGPAGYIYNSILDACGACGGGVTDPLICSTACITVPATKKVLGFEKRLIEKAQTLKNRFADEAARSVRNSCGHDIQPGSSRVRKAFRAIKLSGRRIFNRGIEVCGNSCVTVTYARQVKALNPQFKILEQEAFGMANDVKQCYAQKGLFSSGGGARSLAETVDDVRQGLNQLIQDCRRRKVCPR